MWNPAVGLAVPERLQDKPRTYLVERLKSLASCLSKVVDGSGHDFSDLLTSGEFRDLQESLDINEEMRELENEWNSQAVQSQGDRPSDIRPSNPAQSENE